MRFLWVGLARAGVALVYISVSIVGGLVAAGGADTPSHGCSASGAAGSRIRYRPAPV